MPPREEFKLRELDNGYVQVLKQELLTRPLSFAKPLIGIVKDLHSKDHFNKEAVDAYEIEVIGGNHRRQAFEEIKRHSSEKVYEFTNVQLYTGRLVCFCFCFFVKGNKCCVINSF